MRIIAEDFKSSKTVIVVDVIEVVLEGFEREVPQIGILPEASVEKVGLVEHWVCLIDIPILLRVI